MPFSALVVVALNLATTHRRLLSFYPLRLARLRAMPDSLDRGVGASLRARRTRCPLAHGARLGIAQAWWPLEKPPQPTFRITHTYVLGFAPALWRIKGAATLRRRGRLIWGPQRAYTRAAAVRPRVTLAAYGLRTTHAPTFWAPVLGRVATSTTALDRVPRTGLGVARGHTQGAMRAAWAQV